MCPDNLWDKCGQLRPDDLPPRARGGAARLPALRLSHAPARGAAAGAAVRRRHSTTASSCRKSDARPAANSATPSAIPIACSEAQAKTSEQDAIIVAHGTIGGLPAVIAAFNFDFMGGSMGSRRGRRARSPRRGLRSLQEAPLVAFTASGGARMQEGALWPSMQMARTTLAVQDLKTARLPYIVVLTDPTYGGVTASYAMLGDVQLAEPGALIGFTGPRIIEQTLRETLPPGFQRAEYLVREGDDRQGGAAQGGPRWCWAFRSPLPPSC